MRNERAGRVGSARTKPIYSPDGQVAMMSVLKAAPFSAAVRERRNSITPAKRSISFSYFFPLAAHENMFIYSVLVALDLRSVAKRKRRDRHFFIIFSVFLFFSTFFYHAKGADSATARPKGKNKTINKRREGLFLRPTRRNERKARGKCEIKNSNRQCLVLFMAPFFETKQKKLNSIDQFRLLFYCCYF